MIRFKTPEHAEIAERIAQAFAVLRRLPDCDRGRLCMQTLNWPAVILNACTDYAPDLKVRMPPPSALAITQMIEVFEWVAMLGHNYPDLFKVVYRVCVRQQELRVVGRALGRDHKAVRARLDHGLELIAAYRRHKAAA